MVAATKAGAEGTIERMDATADYSRGYPVVLCPRCGHENHLKHLEAVFAFRCRECDQGINVTNFPPPSPPS
jgi:hypothetical protein